MLSLAFLASPAIVLPEVSGMTHELSGLAELKRRFQTSANGRNEVAVVGSSGNLLYRGQGAEIDAMGAVLRVNGAVTEGYEVDVYAAPSPDVLATAIR